MNSIKTNVVFKSNLKKYTCWLFDVHLLVISNMIEIATESSKQLKFNHLIFSPLRT